MNRLRMFLVAGLLLGAGATLVETHAVANEQRGSYTENKRWGFKIRSPKKWPAACVRAAPWLTSIPAPAR